MLFVWNRKDYVNCNISISSGLNHSMWTFHLLLVYVACYVWGLIWFLMCCFVSTYFSLSLSLLQRFVCFLYVRAHRAACTSIHFIICWFLNSLLIFAVFLLRSLDSGKVIIYRKFNKCFCSFSLNLEFLKLRNAINASSLSKKLQIFGPSNYPIII